MALTLADIKVFREVVRVGTMSAASRSLGLTQPALSWTVKKLEQEIGHPLLIRSNKGVRLTRAGQVLHDKTTALIRYWESLGAESTDVMDEVCGRYTIGVYDTLARYTLPRFLPQLLQQYPRLELNIEHDLSRHIAEGVISHAIDFGIVVNPPRHPALTIVDLYRDEMAFWQASPPTRLQYGEGETVLILMPRVGEGLVDQAVEGGLFLNPRRLYTTNLSLMRDLVAAGTGIGMLPRTIALKLEGAPLLMIPNSPTHPDVISLVFRRENQMNCAARAIKAAILKSLCEDAHDTRDLE